MSAAALGMSSSGWIWCVQDANGALGIVPTFGHGTVLVRNRMHRSPFFVPVVGEVTDPRHGSSKDPATPPSTTSPTSGTSARLTRDRGDKLRTPLARGVATQTPAYTAGDMISHQAIVNFSKIGGVLNPLFCISINEHAWVSSGYGVWGKEEYLKRFWSVLDWGKVSGTSEYWMSSSIIR
jgi:Fe-Mn family superoxide dismutase